MSEFRLRSGSYCLRLSEEKSGKYGCAIYKEGQEGPFYETAKPVILILKDYAAKHVEFADGYESVVQKENGLCAKGRIRTPMGSVFTYEDSFEPCEQENTFLFHRRVRVERAAADDLGFGSRVALGISDNGDLREHDCFAPGAWYQDNRYAPAHFIGRDQSLPCYWYRETRFALPLFAVQSRLKKESAVFSRARADIRASETYERHFDSRTDASYTYGSLGVSVKGNRFVHGEEEAKDVKISLDYVYPGTEGFNEDMTPYRDQPYRYQFGLNRRYHPVQEGFCQDYSLVWHFSAEKDFRSMMKHTWRFFYDRFSPAAAAVDNEKLYHVCMDMFDELCRDYYGSWGVPFKCLLPSGEIGIVDYQMGFIGQQPNIGYQLLRYGHAQGRPETAEKGIRVLDWWVHNTLTEWGAPRTWYDPHPAGWVDQPIWLRMLADGMEGILDGYVYLKKQGDDRKDWLAYCVRVGDWLVDSADGDGCWHRAYHPDGSVCLESRANTSNVLRFLVQLYLATGEERYRAAALKAGEWCYEHIYQGMQYVGGTCDNEDVLDKESGIYAIMGFLALYDLTGEEKWLEACRGAADYTETWTYSWAFPVKPIENIHAFHHVDMSGQSLIATGHSGADVYMAACSYLYYRLYLITGDEHYRDFAIFISKNPKQGTDLDGSYGYGRKGLCEESSDLYAFDCRGVYAWLPWVTYVQTEPVFRMKDTFGVYEIEDAEKLPKETLLEKNRIYAHYAD